MCDFSSKREIAHLLDNETMAILCAESQPLSKKGDREMANNKKKTKARYDSKHIRLQKGEAERPQGGYVYRWTGKDGKRHAVYEMTLEKLRIREEEIAADARDGIRQDKASLTVNELFELWAQLKRGIKDSTMKNYLYMYEMFVKPSFGKNCVIRVRKSHVRAFYNNLIDGNGLKISTLDGIHNVLHQVFQVAVDDDIIRANPTDNMLKELKLARNERSEKRDALTLPQQKLFFEYLLKTPQYTHWYPVFFIMANTGMRVGEITGLRWRDIDLDKGTIIVSKTLVYYNHRDGKGCYYSINTPKTKAGEREIPMTEDVKQAFLMEQEYQKEGGIKCLAHIDGYDDFIFINRYGQVQNQATLNKALHRIMRDCNLSILDRCGADSNPVLLPNFSCHILRHTFCTRCVEAGLNVKAVQSLMGHADISTTLQIYASLTEEMKQREMAAYQDYVKVEMQA